MITERKRQIVLRNSHLLTGAITDPSFYRFDALRTIVIRIIDLRGNLVGHQRLRLIGPEQGKDPEGQ